MPASITAALLDPPPISALSGVAPPERISLALTIAPDGKVDGSGRLHGKLPPPPALPEPAGIERDRVFAEALLPIDLDALVIKGIVSQMAITRVQTALNRAQRNWVRRFEILADAGVDLKRDLSPALGKAVRIWAHDPPPDIPTQYGIFSGTLPFDTRGPQSPPGRRRIHPRVFRYFGGWHTAGPRRTALCPAL